MSAKIPPNQGPKATMTEDGLRYVSRPAGSMFGTVSAKSSMSCFWCGVHRPPSVLASKRIFGKNQKVCANPCEKNPARQRLKQGKPSGSPAS
jgi:hypothetical protein